MTRPCLGLVSLLFCSSAVLAALPGCGGSAGDSPHDSGAPDTIVGDASPGDTSPPGDAGDGGNDARDATDATRDALTVDVVSEPDPNLGPPTFNPPDGSAFCGVRSVTIAPPPHFPPGGTIYFTTDQTIPTHASKVYVGPIELSESETITALASAPGLGDSAPAHATYTVIADCSDGGAADPLITPTSSVANNDFLASITMPGDPSATICYRLDGQLPTCTSSGVCAAGSMTYSASAPILITGAVATQVSPPTGAVTLTAIACGSTGSVADCGGGPDGIGCEADYILKVADPTMTGPAPGTLTWGTSALPSGSTGASPSLATTTVTTNNPVTIAYDVAAPGQAATPTCATGTAGSNPTQFDAATGPAATITSSVEITAIGCKAGYASSSAKTFTYDLSLAQPTLPAGGAYSYPPQIAAAADAVNAGSGDVLCYTAGAPPTAAATCGATGGCGAGSAVLTSTAAPTVGNTTSASTVASLVACPAVGRTLGASPVATQTYTLRYAQLFASSTDPVGLGLPGWGFASGGSGAPVTTFPLPSGAGTANGYPVSDTCTAAGTFDAHGHCVWQVGLVEPLPGCAGDEFGCPSSAATNLAPAYLCTSTQRGPGSLACGTTANTCASGTTVTFSAAPPAATNLVDGTNTALGALYAADAGTSPDTLSLMACPDVVTHGAVVVQPSLETDVGP